MHGTMNLKFVMEWFDVMTECSFLRLKQVVLNCIILELISAFICVLKTVVHFAQVVCGKCSNQKYPLPFEDNKLSRVCRSCHQNLVQQKSASPERSDCDAESIGNGFTLPRGLLEVCQCG
jgi:hypothetical protein